MTQSSGKSNRLIATNEDTLGPYYPISLCDNDSMDLTEIRSGIINKPLGEKIIINGCIKDINGNLANGILLEFWQPNAAGIYRRPDTETHHKLDPWFTGYARHRPKDGNFTLTTIKPGVDVDLETPRFFEGEKANDTDPLLLSINEELRDRLMIKPDGEDENGIKKYKIEIIMAGDNETPFFDDLLS